MAENDDVALNFGEEDEIDRRRQLKHPVAVFCHVAFQVLSILAYIFCGWFSSSFITNFVVIVILLSMGFWTVKNVTGRLLVGLRWWNYVDDDGKSHWVYESRPKGQYAIKVSAAEARIFWLSLVICQTVWIVFFFGTLFTLNLKWFMVVVVGTLMNGANLYGYIRCKYGTKAKLTSVATGFLGRHLWKSLLSWMIWSITFLTVYVSVCLFSSEQDKTIVISFKSSAAVESGINTTSPEIVETTSESVTQVHGASSTSNSESTSSTPQGELLGYTTESLNNTQNDCSTSNMSSIAESSTASNIKSINESQINDSGMAECPIYNKSLAVQF